MPEFHLNHDGAPFPDKFVTGYASAMFFTNGDTGDEGRLNRLGTKRLTRAARKAIQADCDDFRALVAADLEAAYARGYSEEQAGVDFWFTRQGHGAGYWDRGELEANGLGARLSRDARSMGECHVYVWRGWIHVDA